MDLRSRPNRDRKELGGDGSGGAGRRHQAGTIAAVAVHSAASSARHLPKRSLGGRIVRLASAAAGTSILAPRSGGIRRGRGREDECQAALVTTAACCAGRSTIDQGCRECKQDREA